jgi:hypothetical protein
MHWLPYWDGGSACWPPLHTRHHVAIYLLAQLLSPPSLSTASSALYCVLLKSTLEFGKYGEFGLRKRKRKKQRKPAHATDGPSAIATPSRVAVKKKSRRDQRLPSVVGAGGADSERNKMPPYNAALVRKKSKSNQSGNGDVLFISTRRARRRGPCPGLRSCRSGGPRQSAVGGCQS